MRANRLAEEKSPYLLQHAHNPVNWYPWGPDAFKKAREEDKPIFLSVGYSTCHWCHVMARESFENERIAALLNEHFVSVKVDREERPDIDRIYMLFVQATTGSGGWPMSIWMTPELKPFLGGTYFPPESGYGRPGFADVLVQVAEAWKNQRQQILQSSAAVLGELQRESETAGETVYLDSSVLESGFQYFRRAFDAKYGGFGGAPKFPQPSILCFLLGEHARTGNQEALDMVLRTLRAMAEGRIHDQVGGGFHRYSVDERWSVPHFEKMLYDKAQLAVAYLEASQASGEEFYAGVARDILEYVLRDMTSPEGVFYSAEDADCVIDPAHPDVKGEGAFYVLGQGDRDALLAERSKRPRPHRDDKILTGWNGLMISAFALGARVLGDPRYLAAARGSAAFVLSRLYETETGNLRRRYREGETAIPAFLDDYAFFTQGLLDLYEASAEEAFLKTAVRLTEKQRELFEDRERGGFYSTATRDASLLLQLKDDHDGAEPAGNSVAALNLLRLAGITGRRDFLDCADRTLRAFAAQLHRAPASLPRMLAALAFSLSGSSIARLVRGGKMERLGTATLKGNPLTLIGPELKVGDKAPDFEAVDVKLGAVNLAATGRAIRIMSVVPSLDTPVCDAQTKRFNDEAAKLSGVEIITVSMDLPFAQSRWCGAFGVDKVKMLSDHKNASFGSNYGTLIKELRIESRAIFVVDKDNVIRYVQYVKEVTDFPDFEAALKAAQSLLS